MGRQSAKSTSIDANLKCNKVYPTEKSNKQISELKTIGLQLDSEQATI